MTYKTLLLNFSLLASCILFAQDNRQLRSFELSGTIEGMDTGQIVLDYFMYDDYIKDTIAVRSGWFIHHGKLPEPLMAQLSVVGYKPNVTVYISPSHMHVNASVSELDKLVLTGSVMQDDYLALERMTHHAQETANSFRSSARKLEEQLGSEKDTSIIAGLNSQLQLLRDSISVISNRVDSISVQFIAGHSHSQFALFQLYFYSSFEGIDTKKASAFYYSMDDSIRNTKLGDLVLSTIRRQQKSAPGMSAYYFRVPDINGQEFDLSTFKGQVILLDFWASWCGPCRASTPYLKSLYHRYHSKGFEIVSISSDEKQERWKEAVKEDDMRWRQVAVPAYAAISVREQHPIFANYFAMSIPVYILIDRTGKIIKRWKGWDDDVKQEMSLVIEQQFQQTP